MDLANKRVLVVGLGKSGVASALFLQARGAKVTVSDAKSQDQLGEEIPVLLDHGIAVETGLLEAEALDTLIGFHHRVTLGRPMVTLKLASTLDGRIATQKTTLTAQLNAANQTLQAIPLQLTMVNEIYSAITGYNQQKG